MSSTEFRILTPNFNLLDLPISRTTKKIAFLFINLKAEGEFISLQEEVKEVISEIKKEKPELDLIPFDISNNCAALDFSDTPDSLNVINKKFFAQEILLFVCAGRLTFRNEQELVLILQGMTNIHMRNGTIILFFNRKDEVPHRLTNYVLSKTNWSVEVIFGPHFHEEIDRHEHSNIMLRLMDKAVQYQSRLSFSGSIHRYFEDIFGTIGEGCIGRAEWECTANAKAYSKFARTYPMYSELAKNLLNFSIPRNAKSAADIGCGSGISTITLKGLLDREAKITGYDNSDAMLEVAKKETDGEILFRPMNEIFQNRHDYIFSNAAIWQIDHSEIKIVFKDILLPKSTFVFNIPCDFQKGFKYLTNQTLFEDMVGEKVAEFRTSTYCYNGLIDEMRAYLQVPVFRHNTELPALIPNKIFSTNWLFVAITKF
jgi:trans-aconitate methyltransferase